MKNFFFLIILCLHSLVYSYSRVDSFDCSDLVNLWNNSNGSITVMNPIVNNQNKLSNQFQISVDSITSSDDRTLVIINFNVKSDMIYNQAAYSVTYDCHIKDSKTMYLFASDKYAGNQLGPLGLARYAIISFYSKEKGGNNDFKIIDNPLTKLDDEIFTSANDLGLSFTFDAQLNCDQLNKYFSSNHDSLQIKVQVLYNKSVYSGDLHINKTKKNQTKKEIFIDKKVFLLEKCYFDGNHFLTVASFKNTNNQFFYWAIKRIESKSFGIIKSESLFKELKLTPVQNKNTTNDVHVMSMLSEKFNNTDSQSNTDTQNNPKPKTYSKPMMDEDTDSINDDNESLYDDRDNMSDDTDSLYDDNE